MPGNNQMMIVTGGGSVIYPVVVIVVDGIKCRALIDTCAGSSYASAALVGRLNKRPVRIEHRQIEMMLCSTTQNVQRYELKVASVDRKFEMTTRISQVDKSVLPSPAPPPPPPPPPPPLSFHIRTFKIEFNKIIFN